MPVEETRILTALKAGANPSSVSRDFPRSVRLAGRSAWLFLLLVSLNFMHTGLASVQGHLAGVCGPLSVAQTAAVDYLGTQVEHFLETDPVMPDTDWCAYLRLRRTTYSGEMMLKGLQLTWRQMEPALPPAELSGSVDATALAAPALRPFLERPELSIKPRDEWPARLRQVRVRADPAEWQRILVGLFQRRLIRFLREDQLVYWRGAPLLNGAFGVPKGDTSAPDFNVADVALRFIVNLQPSNDLQNVIMGDIRGLPLFTQWTLCEFAEHECYLSTRARTRPLPSTCTASRRPGWPGSCWAEPRPQRLWRAYSCPRTPAGQRCASSPWDGCPRPASCNTSLSGSAC